VPFELMNLAYNIIEIRPKLSEKQIIYWHDSNAVKLDGVPTHMHCNKGIGE
jgi:hypothetical protein